MNKLEECARAAAKESTDEGKASAVIRCLMEPNEAMKQAGGFLTSGEVFRAMLQSVLDGKE